MKIVSSSRIVLLWLGLGVMLLPSLESAAQAQAATDFVTSSDGSGGLIITGYTGTVKAVVIPGTINGLTVTQIGHQAFQSQNTLTSMTFPASVTTIGTFAFQFCSGLTSLTFTAPSKLTTISTDGFEGCSGLTSITLPPSVTTIGTYAFSHCSGLTSFTVPYGVTDIQQQSFENCTNLATITLPATVTSIDRQAFQNCTSLANVTIPSSVTFIDAYAFFECTALAGVTFNGDAPTINANAFVGASGSLKITYYAYASNFTTPTWTDSGGDTFTTNTPLTNPFQTSTSNNQVTIDGYTGSASALDIPGKIGGLPVVALGAAAFIGKNITSVSFPGSLASIGADAFEHCHFTSVNIPASVTSIGAAPFSINFGLTAITVDPANPNYLSTAEGVILDKNETTVIEYPTARSGAYTVPASVTTIGQDAFNNVVGLTSITLPAVLTSIGDDAFANSGLTSITLPSQLTSIGSQAFLDCGLTSVTIPASVTSIASQAFNLNFSMTSAVFNGDAPTMGTGVFANTHSGFTVSYYAYATGFASPTWNDGQDTYPANSIASPFLTSVSNNQVTITFYTGAGGVLDIPGKIGGLPVVALGSGAFAVDNISSVTFPSTLTSIGSSAFDSNVNLTSISFPANVTSIGDFAFKNCGLTTVTIPANVTSLGAAPFAQNPLTAITVDPANPNYLSTVDGVLLDKNKTTLIEYPTVRSGRPYVVPATVTSIGAHAFETCPNLTSVTLPAGLTSIGDYAFATTGLTSITLPSQLTSIGSDAFSDCGLTTVTIPASVISIGMSAFNFDSNMTSAVFDGNAPTMGSSVFANTATGFTVYYYQGATNFTQPTWNDGGGDSYHAVEIGQATYSQWIAGYPGTTNTSPTATPEHDGVPNLLKYLYNIDPSRPMTAADQDALPTFGIAPTGNPSLTFRQGLLFGPNGTTINVQTSTDLQTWTTVPKATTPTTGSYTIRATGPTGPNGDPYMEIDLQPASATPRLFIRLNVTQP